MNLNWGFGECYICHDRQGPWVLVENRKWYCENCHKKYVKKLLSTTYVKDEQQHNDKA